MVNASLLAAAYITEREELLNLALLDSSTKDEQWERQLWYQEMTRRRKERAREVLEKQIRHQEQGLQTLRGRLVALEKVVLPSDVWAVDDVLALAAAQQSAEDDDVVY